MDKLKMHTTELVQMNIAKIRELFPSCVTEAADEHGEGPSSVGLRPVAAGAERPYC